MTKAEAPNTSRIHEQCLWLWTQRPSSGRGGKIWSLLHREHWQPDLYLSLERHITQCPQIFLFTTTTSACAVLIKSSDLNRTRAWQVGRSHGALKKSQEKGQGREPAGAFPYKARLRKALWGGYSEWSRSRRPPAFMAGYTSSAWVPGKQVTYLTLLKDLNYFCVNSHITPIFHTGPNLGKQRHQRVYHFKSERWHILG